VGTNLQFDPATPQVETIFSRSTSGAEVIEELIRAATISIAAALYRLANPRLVAALGEAARRGVSIRLCLNDNDHYEENRAAQAALATSGIAYRLLQGKAGNGSKMHHKFVVLDGQTVATGSYNWTMESEERNYENLILLRAPELAIAYLREFEALWKEGSGPPSLPASGS